MLNSPNSPNSIAKETMSVAEGDDSTGCRVLLCCTGSVASIKVPQLVRQLQQSPTRCHVRLVSTQHARHFFSSDDLPADVAHFTDEDEWSVWRERGDPVQHIVLRDWADVLLIAPLDANTMAKLVHGLCDNLVTCIARAWPVGDSPVVVAPAMNTGMWKHPVTEPQVKTLQQWGYVVVPPVEKTLMCGETGVGAMAALDDIVEIVTKLCKPKR